LEELRMAESSIVGTWRLIGAKAFDVDGKQVGVPYGPQGMGLVTLNADGRMMAVLCDGRAALPAGARREYNSYCGNYTFDGRTLITKVDACSDPARLASDQVREVRFENGRMVLRPPVTEWNGMRVQREMTWDRIA
jgi:hypothetical protein